jgi:hypothetical protein
MLDHGSCHNIARRLKPGFLHASFYNLHKEWTPHSISSMVEIGRFTVAPIAARELSKQRWRDAGERGRATQMRSELQGQAVERPRFAAARWGICSGGTELGGRGLKLPSRQRLSHAMGCARFHLWTPTCSGREEKFGAACKKNYGSGKDWDLFQLFFHRETTTGNYFAGHTWMEGHLELLLVTLLDGVSFLVFFPCKC